MPEKKPARGQPMTPRDFTGALQDAPRGAWAALSNDRTRLAASADSIEEATRLAHLNGENDPLLIWVPMAEEGLSAGVK